MKKVILGAILAITLCGCAEQIAARQAAQKAAFEAQKAALDAQDDATCRSYGANKGTQQYFDCRMSLNVQHSQMAMQEQELLVQQEQIRAANSQAALAASAAILSGNC